MSSVTQRNSHSDRKPLQIDGINDADLPNIFYDFYSRSEKHDFSENIDFDIVIIQACVRDLLQCVNIGRAPGPDHICGRAIMFAIMC